jgi:sugar phosphate isomerase/epimerase
VAAFFKILSILSYSAWPRKGSHSGRAHIKDLKVQKGVAADEWYFFSCTPVGEGLVNNSTLVQLLADAGYEGLLAVEIDFLHPDYDDNEDQAVVRSVDELSRLANSPNIRKPLSRGL